ncbi:uncharacterized protein [Aegilops tauschii subsp. strangulata]|uniref:uncharacterized protein isoform X2 n=1 Tax=Aegilops tauschii subsp. strangulata TaxID=200361 RepID=UPI003CC8DC2B
MELVGEDEVVSDEETEDHDIVFESEQLNLEVQYDSKFPALRAANESKKWGPVQAARMSSRIAGDKRTSMEKAQQLKKVRNLEVHKTHDAGAQEPDATVDDDSYYTGGAYYYVQAADDDQE